MEEKLIRVLSEIPLPWMNCLITLCCYILLCCSVKLILRTECLNIYIYIYMCVCVCVCAIVWVNGEFWSSITYSKRGGASKMIGNENKSEWKVQSVHPDWTGMNSWLLLIVWLLFAQNLACAQNLLNILLAQRCFPIVYHKLEASIPQF